MQNWKIWFFIICASSIMMVTTGVRLSTGLFLPSLMQTTGLSISFIGFVLAVGQFMWGAAQPFFGIIADQKGTFPVLVAGALLLAGGMYCATFASSETALILTLGIISAAGAGAGSFALLIGATSKKLPAEKRSFAAGFINAGGSFGQFVFATLSQNLIIAYGWIIAMKVLAYTSLVTILPAWFLDSGKNEEVPEKTTEQLLPTIKNAFKNKSYLFLHAGFFTCGFHVAFLVTHLPVEIGLHGHSSFVSSTSLGIIGLCNIAGSLLAGFLGNYYRMKMILFVMYTSRALMILAFLFAPKTVTTFYIFASAIGFTWLATVPPTSGLVGKLFGLRYLATLFGIMMFTHQVGAFLGAWVGGLVVESFGNYWWLWVADMLLAFIAALTNLPVKEDKVIPKSVTT